MSANGQLRDDELAPIAGGGRLRKDAARSWNAFANMMKVQHGFTVGVNDSYRPLGKPGDAARGVWSQWAAWEKYQNGTGNLAARPGTSNHGEGAALDLSPETIDAVAKYGDLFGWNHNHTDAPSESWHHLYLPSQAHESVIAKWSPNAAPVGDVTVRQGSNGPAVAEMKKQLKRHGFWPALYPITNKFNRLTTPQLMKFQKVYGLTPDGICGPGTWKVLKGPVKSKPKPPAPKPPAPKPPAPKPVPPKPASPKNKYFADCYEGDNVNMAQYKLGGYPLIVLKASEGKTYRDKAFAARFREAGRLGITRFVYHFARPGNGNSAVEEAQNFCAAIKDAGKLNPDDRLVLDWEDPKFENKNGDKWIADFIKEVGRQGHTVRVIYSGGWYLPGTVSVWPKDQTGKPLRYWHSAYNSNPIANIPTVAKGKGILWAVQYTDGSTGTLEPKSAKGIGPCDMNYLV
jgi:Glycosyl hydrolases family 25/Putative peptidoglycan binding domain/D-alanyl-D-alanine carboxypeptidase